ncbi:hypothetical protein Aperf_G00000129848 [Anoplocephala perfoliata]
MESDTENQDNFTFPNRLFGKIGSQQRHCCLGILTGFLAVITIFMELQQHTRLLTGWWMGLADLAAAFGIMLCAVRPQKSAFVSSALLDTACIAVTSAGSITLLTLDAGFKYVVAWIGFVTAIFLIYHCLSCIYDAAKWNIMGETETPTQTNASSEERHEEVPDNTRNEEERMHRPQALDPPPDFRLPDEMPKLPTHEAISPKGLPPDYASLSTEPPEHSPPTILVTLNGETRL